MANIYRVSFKIGSFYHSNIALAENPEDVRAYYSEYTEVSVSDGNEGDLREAERKGKPIITVEHADELLTAVLSYYPDKPIIDTIQR